MTISFGILVDLGFFNQTKCSFTILLLWSTKKIESWNSSSFNLQSSLTSLSPIFQGHIHLLWALYLCQPFFGILKQYFINPLPSSGQEFLRSSFLVTHLARKLNDLNALPWLSYPITLTANTSLCTHANLQLFYFNLRFQA